MEQPEDQTYVARLRAHAADRPDAPALTILGPAGSGADPVETLTFADLDRRSDAMAHRLAAAGAGLDDFVTIAAPNGALFLVSVVACWKIGAIPQPVSARLPGRELEAIVDLADSACVVGAELDGRAAIMAEPDDHGGGAPLPEVLASSWKAPTSGGSTGRPKLIVSGDPPVWTASTAGLGAVIGAVEGNTMVMPGPLYHNGPFIWSTLTLLAGGHVVLLPRFDAEATIAAVDRYDAAALYLVPTMMQRIWKLPDDVKYGYDLTSLTTAFHLAEPCPKWLKEAWIDWIGPDAVWELYGGTEGQAFTVLDGNAWREHPGSVGIPVSGEIRILGEDGAELPRGDVGEVWMRPTGRDRPTYRYIGAEPESRDGWECLGDLGWMDDDGYLYLADRRSDMILVGGANVYPAEIEAAINEHPDVRSCAVIGLPDDDKGNQVHAIVQPRDAALTGDAITAFLAERLVTYKLPRTYEFVDEALRDDAGKVRRSALRAERLPAG